MVIRMFEYDISIALEHASLGGTCNLGDCVSSIVRALHPQSPFASGLSEAIVTFADGQKVRYRVPVLQAKKIHGGSDF